MTQNQYVIRRKLNILEPGQMLDKYLGSHPKVGRIARALLRHQIGVGRGGPRGTLREVPGGPSDRHRVATEIEQKVLDYSLGFPIQGQKGISNGLKKQGIQISDGGVRSVWLWHNLQIASLRLKWLEKWSTEN